MKSSEQLVAAIRDLRFAIDRLWGEALAEAQPTVRQALETQARALHADIERLLEDLGKPSDADIRESELAGE